MIKVIKYSKIDFDKYEKCLENACQNTDFAEKKFLDTVTKKKWFILVLGDYEAVMPIFRLRKFLIRFVTMPQFCRQLGVFSATDNAKVNDLFCEFLSNNFLVLNYSFNGKNQFSKILEKKTSYLIKKGDYEEVKSNYSKSRKRNVTIPDNLVKEVIFKTKITVDIFVFFVSYVKGIKSEKKSIHYFRTIISLIIKGIGKFKILQYYWDTQSVVYLYEGKQSFYLSAFVSVDDLANPNLPSIMVDRCLKECIGIKNFDFAGSDIENVAKFNERFGAKPYQYSVIEDNKSTLFKKIFTNYRIISNFAL